ncbi:MAG: 6-carboxytetrahydropterin synthase QueD [Desulfonatronovibrionaceae bacterium]
MNHAKWSLRVGGSFSSSHQLHNYQGKCERLHGHNFRVQVQVSGSETDQATGMLMDFKDLKEMLGEVLGKLDHYHINDLDFFQGISPSSENLARFVYKSLCPLLPEHITLDWAMVAENESSRAYYQETEQRTL